MRYSSLDECRFMSNGYPEISCWAFICFAAEDVVLDSETVLAASSCIPNIGLRTYTSSNFYAWDPSEERPAIFAIPYYLLPAQCDDCLPRPPDIPVHGLFFGGYLVGGVQAMHFI